MLSQLLALLLITLAFALVLGGPRVVGWLLRPLQGCLQTAFLCVIAGAFLWSGFKSRRAPPQVSPPPPATTPRDVLYEPISPLQEYSEFGSWLSQNKGKSHVGVDFQATAGQSVRSIAGGSLFYAGRHGGFGDLAYGTPGPAIVLRHKWRERTFYAVYGHVVPPSDLMQRYDTNRNQRLDGRELTLARQEVYFEPGQAIGIVSGDTTFEGTPAVHLHLGIWDAPSDFPNSGWGWNLSVGRFREPVEFLKQVAEYAPRLILTLRGDRRSGISPYGTLHEHRNSGASET